MEMLTRRSKMFLLGLVAGAVVGGLVVVFFARKNLNTLKHGSDVLHTAAQQAEEKIKNAVDKHK